MQGVERVLPTRAEVARVPWTVGGSRGAEDLVRRSHRDQYGRADRGAGVLGQDPERVPPPEPLHSGTTARASIRAGGSTHRRPSSRKASSSVGVAIPRCSQTTIGESVACVMATSLVT